MRTGLRGKCVKIFLTTGSSHRPKPVTIVDASLRTHPAARSVQRTGRDEPTGDGHQSPTRVANNERATWHDYFHSSKHSLNSALAARPCIT